MRRAALPCLLGLLLTTLLGLVVPPAPAAAPGAGPASATTCQPRAELRAATGVVLLVHGTGEKAEETWSWSYEPALQAAGWAICTVQLPDHGLGDLTGAAPYVVAGIRKASRLAGEPVAVVGHSQGGLLPVWATTWWPGLRQRVTDVVSLAGPFDGTQLGNELCALGRCAPLAWQLRQGSAHVTALREAFDPGTVDVTSVSTRYDEVVRPQPAASHLPGASNVMLQDVCAADPSEHGVILGSPVAFAVVLDALTHDGAADPARVPAETCQQTFIPNGDPAGSYVFLQGVARFATGLADPRRWVDREPPLPAYAR